MDVSAEARQAAQRQAIADVRAFVAELNWGPAEAPAAQLPQGLKPAPLLEVDTVLG